MRLHIDDNAIRQVGLNSWFAAEVHTTRFKREGELGMLPRHLQDYLTTNEKSGPKTRHKQKNSLAESRPEQRCPPILLYNRYARTRIRE